MTSCKAEGVIPPEVAPAGEVAVAVAAELAHQSRQLGSRRR
jgi:hypothetical protein